MEIPGSAVEENESPTAACRREVIKELALDRPIGRILAIDWVPPRPERTEGLMLVSSLDAIATETAISLENGHPVA